MEDCIFCKIIKGEIPSFTIYEDSDVYSFADINPIAKGHTLVIPKGHYENIWEIPENSLLAIHAASKKIARAISDTLKPAGIACLQLNGKAVNQVVMHYHLHLIPRMADGPELPMTAWELVPGNMAEIEETTKTIASAL